MDTMKNVDALSSGPKGGAIKNVMVSKLGEVGCWFDFGIDALVPHMNDIVYCTAITQKDPIPVMLSLGARYFSFRPAHMHKNIRSQAKTPTASTSRTPSSPASYTSKSLTN